MQGMAITTTYHIREITTQLFAWIAAGMFVLMLLTQLYQYENFASVLSVILPFNNQIFISLTAAVIVISELASLPYLLAMKLSKLAYVLAGAIAMFISTVWLLINLTNAHAANAGIFGDTLALPGGVMAFLWSAVLVGVTLFVIISDAKTTRP